MIQSIKAGKVKCQDMEAVDHIVLLIRKQIVTGSGGGV